MPIQQHVEFQAADPGLVGSYLYAQARAAGCAHVPSRAQFERFFEGILSTPRIPEFAVQDEPQLPEASQLDRSRDLRRVLEEMKFWLVNGGKRKVYGEDVPRDVREVWAACGKDVVETVGDWSVDEIVCKDAVIRDVKVKYREKMDRLWEFAENLSNVDAGLERQWGRQMQVSICVGV